MDHLQELNKNFSGLEATRKYPSISHIKLDSFHPCQRSGAVTGPSLSGFFWWYKPGTRTPSLPNFSIAEDKCSYHSFSTGVYFYSTATSQLHMKSHERCCWKKEEAWTSILYFLICGGISWSLRVLFRLISLKARKREKMLIFTRYTHSYILPSVCVEASPGVTGVGNFCSASIRFLWGYLATTNVGFSSAGCNLAFLAEQGTGTAELEPCSKSHGNFIPSSLPLSERKETQGSSAEM